MDVTIRHPLADHHQQRRGAGSMAAYEVNPAAVTKARGLIDARQYVLDSDWG